MDPALEELLEGPAGDVLEVLVRLQDPLRIPVGVTPVARFGDVVSARLARGEIRRVWADPRVVSLKAPRLLEYAEEVPLPPHDGTAEASGRRPGVPETGRGVVVGVLDWGFDVTSPAFRHTDGGSRIAALWDQRDRPGGAPTPYGYGVVHRRAAIEAALRTASPEGTLGYRAADADPGTGAHGTHVADIAAGTPGPRREGGVAPGAELVLVNLAAGQLSGLAGLGDSVRILEGLDFIRRVAGDRPFVANLSLGRHAGPQNGTTLVERAIDALVAGAPGRAVVMSTGNYQLARAHATGRLTPGGRQTVSWEVSPGDMTGNELEIWYPDTDRLHAILEGPGGAPRIQAALGHNRPIELNGAEVGRLYHRAFDPNSPDHHVAVFLRPGAPAGTWTLTLVGEEVSDGRWHAFVERDGSCPGCQSVLAGPHVARRGTLGSICNGLLSITVGAADTTGMLPGIARFSSSGPTRDGRQKPDLLAPGVAIAAARSRSAAAPAGGVVRKSGASQAAPYVAGTIALAFEAAGRKLSIHETRAVIIGTAVPLPVGRHDPLRAGAGLVAPEAALAAARARRQSGAPGSVSSQRRAGAPQPAQQEDHAMPFRAAMPGPAFARRTAFESFAENPAAAAAGATRISALAGGISAAGGAIGLLNQVIEFGERRVFTGAFTLNTQEARVTPLPRGLAPEFTVSRTFQLRCVQPVISDDIMAFQVTVTADCFNIYNVAIVRDEGRSAFLINSTLTLNLQPDAQQVRGTLRPNIPFWIRGRWDPTGPIGNEDFSGRLLVSADGAMELSINAPGRRVRVEGAGRYGPARSCPRPEQPDPGAPTPAPISPPDQAGRGGQGRGGGGRQLYPDSRHLLPTGPMVTHVFFLTSAPTLSQSERNRLQSWLNQLGTPLVEQIRAGGVPVYVTGHASRSGNELQNMELSTRRARAAAELLRELLGPGASIRYQGQGSRDSVGGHPNDQADRRATIRLHLPN